MDQYKGKTIEQLERDKAILLNRLNYEEGKAEPLYGMRHMVSELLDITEGKQKELRKELGEIEAILSFADSKSPD